MDMSLLSLNNLGDLLRFVVVLSVLVLVHELGHFIVARKNGIWVEEFGVGLPPRVWGKKIGDTLYSINLFPLGGFVRLHGEQTEEGVSKPNQAFVNKSKKIRFYVLSAGVVMNFLLAIACFSTYYSFSGIPREVDRVIITAVVKDAPADKAGLESSDTVISVDGKKVESLGAFSGLINERRGRIVSLRVLTKEGIEEIVEVIPRVEVPPEEGPLGVAISNIEIYYPPAWKRPFIGIYLGFKDAVFWGKQILLGLYVMVTSLAKGQIPKEIAGPIGMLALTTEVAKLGLLELINFTGIISVNLAIVNFLPIPALDGGRFLFIVIEKIFGRKVVPKIEAAIHGTGMAFLLGLMFIITFVEAKRLILAGSLQGFLESTIK